MKIALTAIIKNEAHDILYWLAWHARTGVDSFILFDDNSSDGTRDLLTIASLYWDIRLYHVRDIAISPQGTQTPGKAALLCQDALARLQGEEFDWAGFLTANDYIKLHHHANLREFFASRTENTHYIDLPLSGPAPQAGESIGAGSHSRCFLRPASWQPADEQTLRAKGAFIQQEGESGAEGEPRPVWPVFPAPRTASPGDLPVTLTSFHSTPGSDSTATDHDGLPDIMAGLFPVIRAGMLNTLEQLKLAKPLPPRLPLPSTSRMAEHIHINYLQSETGWPIGMRDRLAQALPEGETAAPLMLLQSRNLPSKGFLFAWEKDNTIHPLAILGDQRAGGLLSYDILPVMGRDAIALGIQSHVEGRMSRRFLSCPPAGPLVADRSQADLWEFFTLVPQPLTPADTSWLEHPVLQFAETLLEKPITLQSITQILHVDRDIAIWLLPLLAGCLPRHEQLELQGYLGPFVQFNL